MYSKAKVIRERQDGMTPPPGYGGNRFRTEERECDDGFPKENCTSPCQKPEKNECREATLEEKCEEKASKCLDPLSFLKNIDKEELLIIALIIILAGEKDRVGSDTLLLLILLLCT